MYLKHEPKNPYDKNAVAICTEEMSKCAYLRKDDVKFISRLFKESLVKSPDELTMQMLMEMLDVTCLCFIAMLILILLFWVMTMLKA
jgi:hypothetical protein